MSDQHHKNRIKIYHRYVDVAPYLADIKMGADSSKEELGFFPHRTYDEFAISGGIFAATLNKSDKEFYAGHILFGGVYPNAKIFQLYVSPAARNQGVASALIRSIKSYLYDRQWLSIKASVAEDLFANLVWEHHGFRLVNTRAGGKTRRRKINIRVLQLETPSLLNFMQAGADKEIRLIDRFSTRPVYLIDLNVFFDNLKRKRPRHVFAAKVIREAMSNNIRLMISEEFVKELERTSYDENEDAILSLARNLNHLKIPPNKYIEEKINAISKVIFNKPKKLLSDRDISDIKHISTAIYHGTAGFITSEKSILQARDFLQENYKIDVVGVEEFSQIVDSGAREIKVFSTDLSSTHINFSHNNESELAEVQIFLSKQNAEPVFIYNATLIENSHWTVVNLGNEIAAYAKWSTHGGLKKTTDIYLCANEIMHEAEAIIDHLISNVCHQESAISSTILRLHIMPGHNITRQIAISVGFSNPIGLEYSSSLLQKISIGRIVHKENWNTIRRNLISLTSITLPKLIPKFDDFDQNIAIEVNEKITNITLRDLERVISPALFLIEGRDGVITPIRQEYADRLFDANRQLSAFSPGEAILRHVRIYVSSSNKINQMKAGMPIVFYGSGMLQHAFAIGRIIASRLVSKSEALENVSRHGVLNERTIKTRSITEIVTETSFDNIFIFKTPIPLKRLREIGCVDDSNMVTARRISFAKLMQVVKEGF